MTARTHDYDQLKREFLSNPDLSIRELCRRHDIKGYSSVAKYARENDWYRMRDQIKDRREDKVIERVAENLAEAQAEAISELTTDWLTITRAALYKFGEQLRDPNFLVRTDDLTKLMDKGLVLTGQPSERTEARTLALSGTLDELPPEFLRRLAERTRPRQLDAGRSSGTPPTDPEGPRPN